MMVVWEFGINVKILMYKKKFIKKMYFKYNKKINCLCLSKTKTNLYSGSEDGIVI